jgi:hypothetical protein
MTVIVFTNGTNHFVLRNASVQLTISEGRINSLIDVKLGLVASFFTVVTHTNSTLES